MGCYYGGSVKKVFSLGIIFGKGKGKEWEKGKERERGKKNLVTPSISQT